MHSELSEEIRDRIKLLCDTISVSHHLNEEIREELRDHITDKMEAYLYGEEVLSEDDAFVLVREQFGDPDVIRSMYESAEPVAAYGNMLRRIGAATVATILFLILGGYVFELLFASLAKLTSNSLVPDKFIYAIPKTLSQIVGMLLFGTVLSHWRGKIKRGEQPWFLSIKPLWFIGLIFSSILVMIIIIHSSYQLHMPYNFFTLYTLLASIMFHCILWLMWIDNNSKRIRSIVFGFISWIVIQSFIMSLIFRVIGLNLPGYGIPLASISYLGLPSVLAIFIYTLLVAIHRVKIKLSGSLA
ncbi:permease prefix domain 1-containing protein [Candidatus Latescibacterota bacterium]